MLNERRGEEREMSSRREPTIAYDARIPASTCRPVLLLICSPSSSLGSGGGRSTTFLGKKRGSPSWYGFLSSTYLVSLSVFIGDQRINGGDKRGGLWPTQNDNKVLKDALLRERPMPLTSYELVTVQIFSSRLPPRNQKYVIPQQSNRIG